MTIVAEAQTGSSSSLGILLEHFDEAPASYVRVARQLQRDASFAGRRHLRVAVVSTFTLDPFVPYLVVEGARRGLALQVELAPFAQIEQQLLDADSAVYRCEPDVVMIAIRLEDAAPRLTHRFLGLSSDEIEAGVAGLVSRIDALVHAVRARSSALALVWNQVSPRWLAAGLADAGLEVSQAGAVDDLNRRIAAICREVPVTCVFDVNRVAAEVGLNGWEDPKLALLARAPLSVAACVAAARRLARTLRALVTPPCKCLVLDLDNTLWGGVLGEEGIAGIALGEEYPGNVFLDFQRKLASYRDRGVLLAIASKNNESDVLDLFRSRDMVLRLDDFAARQIHWNDKAGSLRAIADELNIGTDALAFFDDSPVEREWVRARLPEVHVIDVPSDPLRYAAALESSGAFDSLVVTQEDRARAGMYRVAHETRALAEAATSVEEFLRTLEMRVHLGDVDANTLPRVVQLIAKTNQFNLTTRRHSLAEVERMLRAGEIAVWMRVEDRFGDNGLVGVALAVREGSDAFALDTFLMSCRVMGRQVEAAMLHAVARRSRRCGAACLYGTFVPTRKNAPAATFLPQHGFSPVDGQDGRWRLDLAALDQMPQSLYEVIDRS